MTNEELQAKIDNELTKINSGVDDLIEELGRLRAENERLARDARRYEWLRSEDPDVGLFWYATARDHTLTLESLDAAIDAAMSKQEKMDDKAE